MDLKIKDFETALKALEDIVSKLEAGDLPLDRSLELFEQGVGISRFCSAKLEEAERKVDSLVKSTDGAIKEVPFAPEVEPDH